MVVGGCRGCSVGWLAAAGDGVGGGGRAGGGGVLPMKASFDPPNSFVVVVCLFGDFLLEKHLYTVCDPHY